MEHSKYLTAPVFSNTFNPSTLANSFIFAASKNNDLFLDCQHLDAEEEKQLNLESAPKGFDKITDAAITQQILKKERFQAIKKRVSLINTWRQTASFDNEGEFQHLIESKFTAEAATKYITACFEYSQQLQPDIKIGETAMKVSFGVTVTEIPTANIVAVWGKHRSVIFSKPFRI